jgi:hypothetical protein
VKETESSFILANPVELDYVIPFRERGEWNMMVVRFGEKSPLKIGSFQSVTGSCLIILDLMQTEDATYFVIFLSKGKNELIYYVIESGYRKSLMDEFLNQSS